MSRDLTSWDNEGQFTFPAKFSGKNLGHMTYKQFSLPSKFGGKVALRALYTLGKLAAHDLYVVGFAASRREKEHALGKKNTTPWHTWMT